MLETPDVNGEAVPLEEAKPPISLMMAKEYFRESVDATATFDAARREEAAYYHNHQIPPSVEKKWRERGQPLVWTNKIAIAISGILGIRDGMNTDPKCEPRNPDQQDAADIVTKLLRYLNDAARTKAILKGVEKDYFTYGTGAIIVGDGIGQPGNDEIPVRRVRWHDFFYDPASIEPDFSDATYMGVKTWLEASAVRKMFPDAYAALGSPYDGDTHEWSDSKGGDNKLWLDTLRRRVRVVELYFKDDSYEWQRVVLCSAGFLDFGPSDYLDDRGRRLCPILATSYEVNPETKERYGPLMAMLPQQNEYNSRRAVLLHEAQNSRVRQVQEGVDPKSERIAKREVKKADGAIPFGWDVVNSPDIVAGQAMLLEKTERDFDRFAPSTNVLSAMRGGDSGRARQILNQAGLAEWARAFSHLDDLEERMNRHLWFAARQYITGPRAIRVTGDVKATDWLHVNVPVGVREVPAMDPQGQPVIDPMTGQPQMTLEPILEKALAEMDVDVCLTTTGDTVTLQQEANDQILKYAEGTGIAIGDPRFRMVLELFLTVDKSKQLERYDAAVAKLNEANGSAMQMQQQMAELAQKIEELKVQSEALKDRAQARKAEADAVRTEIETEMMFGRPAPAPQPPMPGMGQPPQLG